MMKHDGRFFAETRHRDDGGIWYSLDNAGIIMPSVSDRVDTNLFRLSATLSESVDLGILASVLDAVARRFPYFVVELRRGLFWHYLVPKPEGLRIEPDSLSPMQDYDVNARGRSLVRVRVEGARIACEFHHSIADGTGGLRFLKNLVAEYARRRWPETAPLPSPDGPAWGDEDLYRLDERPHAVEYEDAYRRYYEDRYPPPSLQARAWAPRMLPMRRFEYRVTCGIVPLTPAIAVAKERGASLTELLAAVYIDALQELWLASPARERRRGLITLSVPVNMRKLYPSPTNRNFSLVAFLTHDMRLGERAFDEIVKRAHHQLRFETDARSMCRQLSRNVAAARSAVFRALPLPMKDLAFRIFFDVFGEGLYSGSLSNLGAVSLPGWLAHRVERFDFIPSPARGRTNVGVLSWDGRLYITFGSLGSSRESERLFFTRLRRLGLPVRIECNL